MHLQAEGPLVQTASNARSAIATPDEVQSS